jgi:glycosyltransferase involved in cell wall biosynthesis
MNKISRNPERSCRSLSVILPGYNEGESIRPVIEEVDAVLATLPLETEIIVVDDGSSDNTYESALSSRHTKPLRVIRFSRNFGKEAAMTAGLEAVRTDAAVIMDSDGQHPPSFIPEFVKHWQAGYDVVYAKRVSRATDNRLRRYLSKLYYRIAFGGTRFIEPDAGDFRLLAAPVIKALLALPEKNRFMKGLFNWVGFSRIAIDYEPRARAAGETKYGSLLHLFRFGLMGIMSFSVLPLRLISRLGFLVAGTSVLYGLYIMIRTLCFGVDVPGWATLTVGLALLGGIQLISIGVLGEYIGLIFTEVKNRPLYIVEKSTLQASQAARNDAVAEDDIRPAKRAGG